jgi:hypothetical protein
MSHGLCAPPVRSEFWNSSLLDCSRNQSADAKGCGHLSTLNNLPTGCHAYKAANLSHKLRPVQYQVEVSSVPRSEKSVLFHAVSRAEKWIMSQSALRQCSLLLSWISELGRIVSFQLSSMGKVGGKEELSGQWCCGEVMSGQKNWL